MSITSAPFFALVLCSLILYYLIPRRLQWCLLLLLSGLFVYQASGAAMLGLLCAEAAIVYGGTLLVSKTEPEKRRRTYVIITLVLAIGMLFVLKDLSFFNTLRIAAAALSGGTPQLQTYRILAPIGISYYTLALVGYTLDVYWGKYPPEQNYLRLLLFAGYFPQMTSGPITRFDEMAAQMFAGQSFDHQRILFGWERILWGCFKKMVVADRAAILVGTLFDNYPNYMGLYWVVGLLFYALQLYADFSGCMDIVLGVSECFGIVLPENFNAPFAARSLSEFWRRWHITMGTWFKDYLLYPILKSRLFQRAGKAARAKFGKKYGKKIITCLGLTAVWFSIGLWHGGSIKFILASGVLPGFFIITGELLGPFFERVNARLHIRTDCFSFRMMDHTRVIAAMCCSWLFVRADSAKTAVTIFQQIVGGGLNVRIFADGSLLALGLDIYDFILLAVSLAIITLVGVWHERGLHLRECFQRQNLVFRWAVLLCAIFTVLIFGIYGPGYDATSFIYKNF